MSSETVSRNRNPEPAPIVRAVPPEPRIQPIHWPLVLAWLKYILWQIVTKLVLVPIYLTVVAEGFRCVIPTLAAPVLGDDEEGVDRAMLFAAILLVAVWLLWERALLLWLNDDTEYEASSWSPENHRNLILILSVIILGVDGCLFFLGCSQLGLGRRVQLPRAAGHPGVHGGDRLRVLRVDHHQAFHS